MNAELRDEIIEAIKKEYILQFGKMKPTGYLIVGFVISVLNKMIPK